MDYPLEAIGVDEVGRGCLAGPVTVCALRLRDTSLHSVLTDSKKLSAKKRDDLFEKIIQIADFRLISYPAAVIDDKNILQATLLAMAEALEQLSCVVDMPHAYIDGNHLPKTDIACTAVIGGDGIVPAISAASIIAKVSRDRYMQQLDNEYPAYGFGIHKGYGTKKHLEAMKQHGITPYHRLSFAPCRLL